MRPVVLIFLPARNRFVGTFDVSTYRNWWLGGPLPKPIEELIDCRWVYGSNHCAMAKLLDGTYSLFRSPDYGLSWQETFNTPNQLYAIRQIEPGWMLISSSAGWYETVDSAQSVQFISNQAPGVKDFCEIGGEVLLGHSGDNIWKSTNRGRVWRNLGTLTALIGWPYTKYATNPYATIAGYNQRVFASAGRYVVHSDNEGEDWHIQYMWSATIVRYSKSITVRKIVPAQILGAGAGSVRVVVQAYLSDLNVLRHYAATNPGGAYPGWAAKFDLPYSEGNHLDSYQILRPGSSDYEYLVVSGQQIWNSSLNQYVPDVRISINGGDNWSALNTTTARVYSGPDPTIEDNPVPNPFTEDSYSKAVWSGPGCHNSGRYIVKSEKWERGLSFDIDTLLQNTIRTKEFSLNSRVALVGNVDLDVGADLQAVQNEPLPLTTVVQKAIQYPLMLGGRVKTVLDEGIDLNSIVVTRGNHPLPLTVPVQRLVNRPLLLTAPVRGTVDGFFGLSAILVKDQTDVLRLLFARFVPQFWHQDDPTWPYEMWDSRKMKLEDI